MKRSRFLAASAAAFAAALTIGGAAYSQNEQLQAQVRGQLSQHGIEIQNFEALSDTQLQQIALLLGTSESQNVQRASVESLLAIKEPCVGNDQMRASVAAQLRQHNITLSNIDTLNGSELTVLQAVLGSNEPPSAMASQIRQIFASDSPILGNDQLRAEVGNCLNRLNVELDLDDLTPQQMIQIEAIAGGAGSMDEKARMIRNLADQ